MMEEKKENEFKEGDCEEAENENYDDCRSDDELSEKSQDDLARELEAERQRAEDFLSQAKRLQAEFDNYRKRTNETNKRVREDGISEVLVKLLPITDAIGQAKRMIEDKKTLDGINMIARQIEELLGAYNVRKIDALGKPFDPNLHNAIMQKESENPEDSGKVLEVYQEGYTLGDRVLRHSAVIVGK